MSFLRARTTLFAHHPVLRAHRLAGTQSTFVTWIHFSESRAISPSAQWRTSAKTTGRLSAPFPPFKIVAQQWCWIFQAHSFLELLRSLPWGSRGVYHLQGYIVFHIPSECYHLESCWDCLALLLKGQDFLVTEVSCIRRTKLYTEVKTLSFLFSIKFTHNSDALNKNMHVFWKIANNQIMFTWNQSFIISEEEVTLKCYEVGTQT